MEKMKKSILKKLASASKFAAIKAAGSTSWGAVISRKNRKQ